MSMKYKGQYESSRQQHKVGNMSQCNSCFNNNVLLMMLKGKGEEGVESEAM